VRQRTIGGSDSVDYQVARSNSAWTDHVARTNVTAGLIAWLKPHSVLDPACGDGSIVLAADRIYGIERISLSDISRPNIETLPIAPGTEGVEVWCHSIETAIVASRTVDVIVLTEILEHLPDPDSILVGAREKATWLVASSPEMRPGQMDTNAEHLWQFDGDGYVEMLQGAGWRPFHKTHMAFPDLVYDFQIWVCR